MINPHNYRFFHRNSIDYYLVAANRIKGFYFMRNGNCYDRRGHGEHNLDLPLQPFSSFREKSLEETLKSLNNKEARDNFLSILNIIPAKIIELKNEDIDRVVGILKSKKAFNGDSAHTFNENEETADLLYTLTDKKIINSIDGPKYFINE